MHDPHTSPAAVPNQKALAIASALVAVSLFLPRPLNFSPLGAFGLFAGAYSAGRRAWLYPLAALTLYVVGIGGYQWLVMGAVYLGFAGPALIGAAWLRGRVSILRVGGGALAASVWFFLISNLGSWIVYGAGQGQTLLDHYRRGVPFFRNTVAGDLFFSGILFGGYALARKVARRAPREGVAA